MNWKHLANIGIGLFLLSMMTPFIEYFTTGKDNTLRFGKYLRPVSLIFRAVTVR